MKISSKNLFQL